MQRLVDLRDEVPSIDLVVLSGDLTETAMPDEFAQARVFVEQLCTSLDLATERVVVVPGNHDVNRDLCQAYFQVQRVRGETPQVPYAQKWEPYEAFVRSLHGERTFTPERPYRLHTLDVNGQAVVVAALNSTIDETHEEHYGHCGESQLRWFADELAKHPDVLRIGVVHHNVRRQAGVPEENLRDEVLFTQLMGPHLDLVLHGHTHDGTQDHLADGTLVLATGSAAVTSARRPDDVPNQCQVLHVRSGSLTRWALRYQARQRRWEADASLSADGMSYREEIPLDVLWPTEGTSTDDQTVEGITALDQRGGGPFFPSFLADVRAVTKLLDGVTGVEDRRKAGFDYLAVFGATGELRAVGVTDGPLTAATLDGFAEHVHRPIRSRAPQALSELVHTGTVDVDLRDRALRQGIVVKSWAEYQNLLDLSAYEITLREGLLADPLYPQGLYITQRYRTVDKRGRPQDEVQADVAETVLDDLLHEGPRFVLLLGDPGFGKSFLIRRVTHLLLDGTSGITPLVILLRQAEKRHTLGEMVAQALASTAAYFQGEKFRRMFIGGRIVLMVDGYDEFAVRVGYDRAAEQLRTFLRALDGQAKILLTTRPNHFRRKQEAVSQIFEDVLDLDVNQRRVYELEAFDEAQQREYLRRWFARRRQPGRDAAEADAETDAWMKALSEVDDLPELARTPRMLSFMAEDLTLQQIRAAGKGGEPVKAAGLYELLVGKWLTNETSKFRHPGRPARSDDQRLLGTDHRWQVAEDLAYRLWAANETYVSERLLEDVAGSVLDLPSLGLTVAQAAQEIGSRTLLVGEGDERYFAHQSVGEFLLARHLAELLRGADDPAELGHAELSELTARFLRDLVPEEGTRWLRVMAERRPDG